MKAETLEWTVKIAACFVAACFVMSNFFIAAFDLPGWLFWIGFGGATFMGFVIGAAVWRRWL